MHVLVSPEVHSYLYELSQILYDKEYFGFLESAEKYVENLFEEIKTTLPYKAKYVAPPYFERYGKKLLYSRFKYQIEISLNYSYLYFTDNMNVNKTNNLNYLVSRT